MYQVLITYSSPAPRDTRHISFLTDSYQSTLSIIGTFLALAVAAVVVFVFTYLAVPDMTGCSLEKINRMLSSEEHRSVTDCNAEYPPNEDS